MLSSSGAHYNKLFQTIKQPCSERNLILKKHFNVQPATTKHFETNQREELY
jgi:hypothetical protein